MRRRRCWLWWWWHALSRLRVSHVARVVRGQLEHHRGLLAVPLALLRRQRIADLDPHPTDVGGSGVGQLRRQHVGRTGADPSHLVPIRRAAGSLVGHHHLFVDVSPGLLRRLAHHVATRAADRARRLELAGTSGAPGETGRPPAESVPVRERTPPATAADGGSGGGAPFVSDPQRPSSLDLRRRW